MTTLFLLRHGRTANNAEGRLQGPLLDTELDDRGRAEAKACAERLRKEPLAGVYASPLRRARATAQAIAEAHGMEVGVVPELLEFNWGEYLGEIMDGAVKAGMQEHFALWRAGDIDRAPRGGESPRAAAARARPAVERIAARHAGRAFAVVGHGRINKVLLSDLVHGNPSRMEDFPQSNAGITSLIREGASGPWRLLHLNDTRHLDGLAGVGGQALY